MRINQRSNSGLFLYSSKNQMEGDFYFQITNNKNDSKGFLNRFLNL